MKFEEVFNKYTESFDMGDEDIILKYNHSFRVRNLSLKYAHLLGFNEDDTRLAEFIGLYHDIGRFTQLESFHTYNDKESIDHADEGVRVLFEEGLILLFDFTDEEKEIIRFAIKNHNKFEIEKCNDERKIMHAKLIRDTDKLDIVYLFTYLHEKKLNIINKPLDERLVLPFREYKSVVYQGLDNESIAVYFAYPFDINNDICLKEMKSNINEFYKRLDNEIFKEIYELSKEYMEKRINNVRN